MARQCTYHAELGLQLNLQGLHGAPELRDLTLATLHQLAVGGHLTVQLLGLQKRHKKGWHEAEDSFSKSDYPTGFPV